MAQASSLLSSPLQALLSPPVQPPPTLNMLDATSPMADRQPKTTRPVTPLALLSAV